MEPPAVPDVHYVDLAGKEDCSIAYTFSAVHRVSRSDAPAIWLLFVNGLGLPQAYWQNTIDLLSASRNFPDELGNVFATTYDRYGQGLSRNSDSGWLPQSHDVLDSVQDMGKIIESIRTRHIPDKIKPSTVLVAHSIGVPQTRLFMQHTPAKNSPLVHGLLFLDSNMANTDMVSLLPNPDDPDFDPHTQLPSDTTVDDLRFARDMYFRLFHPAAPNPENLDRAEVPSLLPNSDKPTFGPALALTIVAHDPQTFAEESLKICTKGLTERYIEPAWHKYNLGLLKLNGREDARPDDIVIAKNSGHFVQRDNPECVAQEILKLINRIQR